MTEIEQDWVPDAPFMDADWDHGVTTLKLLRKQESGRYWSSPFLADLVFDAIYQGKMVAFKDPACQYPVSWEQLFLKPDSVTRINGCGEEITQLFSCTVPELPFSDFIHTWRLRQRLIFQEKTKSWSTEVLAIAPLLTEKNDNGDSIGIRPLCWIRPDNKKKHLSSNDIIWAKEMVNNPLGTQLAFDSVKIRINKVHGGDIRLLLFDVLTKDPKTPLFDYNYKKLTMPERLHLAAHQDTLITFDPATYEEKQEVVDYQLNIRDLTYLRLVQHWYWDAHRKRLSIHLEAIAPLLDVKGEDGAFRYRKPLFYWRVR